MQCGLCKATCPEKVITLKPQLDFRAATAAARVLKEEEPFHCIRCGKPFGVKSTIERVAAKLEGKHWMFKGSAQRLDVHQDVRGLPRDRRDRGRTSIPTARRRARRRAPPRTICASARSRSATSKPERVSARMRPVVQPDAARTRVRTSVLEIAYEESGAADGVPVFLMHGFPYDPRTYDDVVPRWSRPDAGRSCRICAAMARPASSPPTRRVPASRRRSATTSRS